MEREDRIVKQWFAVLAMMQDCASNLNHDTESTLAEFYAQKHAGILTSDDLRRNFAFCFFRKTSGVSGVGISITADDFQQTGNFHELLDAAFRPLRNSVRALFRRVGIELGSIPEDLDPVAFEQAKLTTVYRTEDEGNGLRSRLRAVMATFSQAKESDLIKRLTDPKGSVLGAINSVL